MGSTLCGVLPHITTVLVASSTSGHAGVLILGDLGFCFLWRSPAGWGWRGLQGGGAGGRGWRGSSDRGCRGQSGGLRRRHQDNGREPRGEVGLVSEVGVTAGSLAAGAFEGKSRACHRIPGTQIVQDAAPDRQGHSHVSCRRETLVGTRLERGVRPSQNETGVK